MTYEESEQLLFSADAFGTFGALNGNLFNDEVNSSATGCPTPGATTTSLASTAPRCSPP